jgi:hypothetical protein
MCWFLCGYYLLVTTLQELQNNGMLYDAPFWLMLASPDAATRPYLEIPIYRCSWIRSRFTNGRLGGPKKTSAGGFLALVTRFIRCRSPQLNEGHGSDQQHAIVTIFRASLAWSFMAPILCQTWPCQARSGLWLGKKADRDRCQNDTRRRRCIAGQTLLVRQAWTGKRQKGQN